MRTVLVCLVLAASAAPAALPPIAAEAGTPALAPEDVDPDTVRIVVSVHGNGTADWRVEYRVELDDENRTAAFESLERDVKNDTASYAAEFREVLSPSVARAEAETGRTMAIRNVSVDTRRTFAPPTGVIAYELEWTAFAAVEGDRLRVGDAISGFYVSRETILRIEWPDGSELNAVRPDPDERSAAGVEWHGRTAFGTEEPRLTVAPAASGGDVTTVPVSLTAVAAVALLATLGLVGRARGGAAEEASSAATGNAMTDEAGSADSPAAHGPNDDPGSDGSDDAPGAPPDELMSNEERVIAALENHGGRMKQQALADRLDWDAPKTSRVVGSLREEEEAVEVFRLGRENVVTLPEEDLLS